MRKNNDRTQKRESRKETLLETLKLPKDICMGALKVTLTGNREAWIENWSSNAFWGQATGQI